MKVKQAITLLVFFLMNGIAVAQDFVANDSTGCDSLMVKFTLDDSTGLSSIFWDFGNGDTSNIFDPPLINYTSYGKYNVSIIVDGDTANPIIKRNYIKIHETLEATYTFNRLGLLRYVFLPSDSIHNTDTTVRYFFRYDYADQDTLIASNTYIVNYYNQGIAVDTFEFPDTGNYRVRFTIRSSIECGDSLRRNIRVGPPQTGEKYKPGNVFSPDSPGGAYYIIEPRDPAIVLLFQVFTRTGILVYKSEAPTIYWDGRTNNGRKLGAGVYFYVLQATKGDPTGYFSTKGFIHLFRDEDNNNFSYF